MPFGQFSIKAFAMMKPKIAIASLVLALAIAAPAKADVVYGFDQTSTNPRQFGFYIDVTDAAAAHGFSFYQAALAPGAFPLMDWFSPTPETPLDLTGSGIVQIDMDGLTSGPFNFFQGTATGFGTYTNPAWVMSLNGGSTGVSGTMEVFAQEFWLTFTLSPTGVVSGSYLTDDGTDPCHYVQGGCSFAGVLTVNGAVGTPEPAALMVLCSGLLGLGLIRQVRRR